MLQDEEDGERDEKEIERYIRYQSLKMVQPYDEKDTKVKRAREEFEKQITPRKFRSNVPGRKPKALNEYKWDFEKKDE